VGSRKTTIKPVIKILMSSDGPEMFDMGPVKAKHLSIYPSRASGEELVVLINVNRNLGGMISVSTTFRPDHSEDQVKEDGIQWREVQHKYSKVRASKELGSDQCFRSCTVWETC
jgi:hypothetical protein